MPKYTLFTLSGRTVVDERTLAEAITENVDRIRAEYQAQIARGIVHRGKILQIDDQSQFQMTAVVGQATAGIPMSGKFRGWRMADNTFLAVTPDQMKALAQAASDRVLALRDVLWTAVDAVRAATTRDQADAVKAAWPEP